jgi:hypothetical protein
VYVDFFHFWVLTSAAQHYFQGSRLRVERKGQSIRRNIRPRNSPYNSGRQQDNILQNLYNQGIQMGLSQDQASRILNIGRQGRNSNAYCNPAYGSPAADAPRHGPSAPPPYGSSQHRPHQGNIEYQQLSVPQISDQSGQYPNIETMANNPQMMPEGMNYYNVPNMVAQGATQYQPTAPMEPIYGGGYSYNYPNENYGPLQPIQENAEPGHQFSHESYGPSTYVGQPYVSEQYSGQSGHGHGQGYH